MYNSSLVECKWRTYFLQHALYIRILAAGVSLTEGTAKAAAKQLPSESGSDLEEESSAQGSTASVHPQEVASSEIVPEQPAGRGGFPSPSQTAALLQQSKASSIISSFSYACLQHCDDVSRQGMSQVIKADHNS